MSQELPDNWVWTTLDQVAAIQGGIQKQQKRRPVSNRYPFLRVANVGRGTLDLDDVHEVELFEGELERFVLRDGDLLVVEGNGSPDQLGRAATWHGEIPDCVHQNHLIRVRPFPVIQPAFLAYVWNSPAVVDQLKLVANSTSGLHTLSTSKLKRIKIPLAPLVEQHRIVEAIEDHLSRLDAADKYLANARRLVSSFDSSQRYELINPWLESTGKLKTILASPLINGRSVPTDDDGFPVLRLTAIRDRVLDLSERKGGAWRKEHAAPFLIQRGDFMVSRGNGSLRLVARGALVVDEPDLVAFPDTMIRVRPDLGRVNPEYLAFVWDSAIVRRQIESAARTTAGIYKVNQSILESIEFPIPPLEVQDDIVETALEHFLGVNRLTNVIGNAKRRSHHLRRSLLAEAFRGRLVPQDPIDEPASELLARVKAEWNEGSARSRKSRSRPVIATQAPVGVLDGLQEELLL